MALRGVGKLERQRGLEPHSSAWKAEVLTYVRLALKLAGAAPLSRLAYKTTSLRMSSVAPP